LGVSGRQTHGEDRGALAEGQSLVLNDRPLIGVNRHQRSPIGVGADCPSAKPKSGVGAILAIMRPSDRLFRRNENVVRQHHSLGTTPAVAAGLEEKPWSLEKVVEMTEAY
jgi:hypothetical protein